MSLDTALDSMVRPAPADRVRSSAPCGLAGAAPAHGALGNLSSDEELQQAVCAALLAAPGLDASGIQVAVLEHGEVTLLGRVATPHERGLALRVAREHAGGRSVHAALTLDPPGGHPGS